MDLERFSDNGEYNYVYTYIHGSLQQAREMAAKKLSLTSKIMVFKLVPVEYLEYKKVIHNAGETDGSLIEKEERALEPNL